nr:RecName: Full=Malate dehydrogenase [Thermoleophilum album]
MSILPLVHAMANVRGDIEYLTEA